MTISKTKISRRGNSFGVVLNKDVLAKAGLAPGDDVTVDVTADGDVRIAKASDDLRARTLEAGEACLQRYDLALRLLAE